ncbi:hypothetical protein Tco_1194630 [Tanacetum coccineum]
MDKTWVMKNENLLTQKYLFITDKHGVPPTKRLFRVPTLDPSPKFIGPWGTSGDPGQPRLIKEFSIWPDQKFIKFVELNFPVITRGFDIKVGMLKGPVSFVLELADDDMLPYTKSYMSTPMGVLILFKPDWMTSIVQLVVDDTRWRRRYE